MTEDNMTERLPRIPTEQLGQEEQGKQLEILDLKNHGALYGRFLLASIAKTEAEAGKLLNPQNTEVKFDLTEDTLKNRNYNLIAEKSSLAERKEQWKGKQFSDAYNQWRTEFTGFMTQIEAGSKREEALGIIMSDSKTKAKDFKESNAEVLFNAFCRDTSDIDTFVKDVITTNLVKDGKIDSENLRRLLPDLQWIASGLFGKETASSIVTRLIELESAIYNDPELVLIQLSMRKGQISEPTENEKRVLGVLYNSFPVPQEKRGPTQSITTAPKPAPVITGKGEPDEDKDKPPPSPPPVSQANGPTSAAARREQQQTTASAAEELTRELERELAYLRDLFAAPGPPQGGITAKPETEPRHKSVIEEVAIERNKHSIRLEVNGTDLGFAFSKYGKGNYGLYLSEYTDTEYLDIPEGMDVHFTIKLDPNSAIWLDGMDIEGVNIIGGKGAKLNVKELYSLGILDSFPEIHILTTKYDGWESREGVRKGHEGQAARYNSHSKYVTGPPVDPWMSMDELVSFLKTRKEEIETRERAERGIVNPAGPEPTETTTGRKIIPIPEITDPADFRERFNDYLIQNQNEPHITFIFSTSQLKEYISSMAEGYDVRGGIIKTNEKGDEITIEGIQINMPVGGKVTLNLIIKNGDPGYPYSRISADIQEYKGNWITNKFRRKVEDSIRDIDSAVKEHLDKIMSLDNSLWSAGNISISKGNLLIRFEKTPENPALEKAEHEINTLPDLASNIAASEQFIKQLRDSSRYAQDLHQPQYMKSDLGFGVTKPVENGWFDAGSVVRTAMDRYKLPLAMYIDGNHARLVVKGAYQTPEGRKIKVYNPMNNGFEEISINETGMPVGVIANILTGGKVSEGKYDIASFFEDSKLIKYRDLLINVKAFGFQRDYQNCLPYCLFVNAMLYGLESGDTEFKREGIKQFEQDFGVKILTREELILQNQE